MKWEYMIKNIEWDLSKELNSLGAEKWELCSMIEKERIEYTPIAETQYQAQTIFHFFQCVFKRQITNQ